jgi:diguanylate cyclase (GGDEF)-like protein/PAS domain S-box-containing protein
MSDLHSLLKRQLRRFAGETKPFTEQEQTDLLQAINEAYWQFDSDRRMLEHSLELTSQELLERNAELSRINTELEMRVAARTAELSSSEARFRGLFEHAPVSIWEEDFSAVRQYIDDLRGSGVVDFSAYFNTHPEQVAASATRVKIVDVNRATLEMYQAESKAQLLADLSKVLGPESLIPFKEELLALARGETSFEHETINYTVRGERRVVFVRLTVAPGYEYTWAKVFVGISDITERRQAEAALAAERDLLQALMDNIPDTIYFKDTSSRFTRINRAQARVLGVATPEDAIGKTDLDFQSHELAKEFYSEEQEIVKSGVPLIDRIEYNPLADGAPRWFSATKVPIIDKDGQVISIVGISRNVTERKQAEAALAAERDLLQSLMDNIPDLIYFKDTSSRFTRINRAEAGLLGVITPEEAIGKTDLDFQNPDLAQSFYEEEQRLVQTGEALINRIEFNPTPDGQPRWFSTTKIPLKNEAGQVTGMVGISHDITKRTLAEEAVQEAEAKYRTLVEYIPAVVYVDLADESRNTIYINSRVQDMLGYSPEDWITKPDLCLDIVHPEDNERMWKELDESEARGRFACDYRYIAKDGHIVWVRDEAVLIKNEGERPAVWQGVILDITAQKEAEEALRQSEERFKLMAWATKDAVWDWDLQINQIWWGEGLQKIFHYSSETAQTTPEWRHDHIHPEDRAKVDRAIDQALEGGLEFWSKEYRFQRKDGTYADIMDRGYIIRDDESRPFRMIGAMMDITERRQNEETIRSQNEMLSSLHQITLDLLRFRENDQLLSALVELSAKFLDASYVEIMLVEGEVLVVKATTQNRTRLLGQHLARDDAFLSWTAFDTHEPAVLSDYASWPHRRAFYDEFLLHAVAVFPILNDDQCLGVLGLGRDKSDHEFTIDQIQYGRLFANLTALVLNNAQLREALREQSIRDPLTGLHNRRYLEEALKQLLSRVTRRLHPLSMIMLDIDHFKHFNDTYGHAVGDGVLRELAHFLESHIRGEDIVCRYGGEEFLLVMPEALVEVAQKRAEDLRQQVRQLRWQNADQFHEGVTLSCGVATYPLHGRTIESVLRAADAALYRAKRNGRDRVEVAEEET